MAKGATEAIVDFLKSGAPQEDAVALAMEEVKKRARGGPAMGAKRDAGKTAPKAGLIHSDVPGRTDEHPTDVPEGSYVIPADVVSALGEGNTMAGASILDDVFQIKRSTGGAVEGSGNIVPIIVAGGEYIVPPSIVMRAGSGDMKLGHKRLDDFVKHERGKTVTTLKNLPGPKK